MANGLVQRDHVAQWGCLIVTYWFTADRRILDLLRSVGRLSFFFSVALRPNTGHGLLILEVSRSHTTTHYSR